MQISRKQRLSRNLGDFRVGPQKYHKNPQKRPKNPQNIPNLDELRVFSISGQVHFRSLRPSETASLGHIHGVKLLWRAVPRCGTALKQPNVAIVLIWCRFLLDNLLTLGCVIRFCIRFVSLTINRTSSSTICICLQMGFLCQLWLISPALILSSSRWSSSNSFKLTNFLLLRVIGVLMLALKMMIACLPASGKTAMLFHLRTTLFPASARSRQLWP